MKNYILAITETLRQMDVSRVKAAKVKERRITMHMSSDSFQKIKK